jgi:hypothetical protein
LYSARSYQGPLGKGFTAGNGFLVKARVLNSVGGSILVTGLAARAASFLAAAAGNGSLQLRERSALEVILEGLGLVLDSLGRAWKAFA